MLMERFFTEGVTNSNKFHDGLYKVYYKTYNEEGHKDVKICIDHVTCSIMKMTVTDERDPRFMFALDLTRDDYSVLQTQQSLLVQFEAFPKQVVRLLEECARGDMLLQLLQTAQSEWCLQFVVRNEFKSLIHLQLLIGRASDADLIKFMSNKVQTLTDALNKAHQSLLTKEDTYRRAIDQRDSEIQSLKKSMDNTKIEIKRMEAEYKKELAASLEHITKERDMWQRDQDNRYESKISDMQSEMQRKKHDMDRIKSELSVKNDKIYSLENSIRDHNSKIKSLEQDLTTARLEHGTLQSDLSRVQRDVNEREGQVSSLKTRLNDLERRLVLKDEQLSKANSSLTMCQQNIAEAESKVTDCMIKLNSKREALQQTNQDLSKANDIITKQNEQVVALKEKVKFRTAVAFEQERVIEKLQSELSLVKTDSADYKKRLDEAVSKSTELTKEILDLKSQIAEKEKTIEYNSTMINWMQKRINETTGFDGSSSALHHNAAGLRNTTAPGYGGGSIYNPRAPFGPISGRALSAGGAPPASHIIRRNIGELSPDLLLPDDIASDSVKSAAVPARTLSQITNQPRCNTATAARPAGVSSKLPTERSAKTVTSSVASENNKSKATKMPQRKIPQKLMSTPSSYFTHIT